MPVFNINSLSTVGGLRKSFKKQFGGTLHVRYNGVLVHNYSNDLALIGGKSGTINYSNQTTVDAFEKDVLNICNLHVKVCTPDEWIEVLGPIKLGTVKDYPIRTNREMMDYSLTNNIQTVGNKYKGSLPNGYTPSVNDLLWYQEKREGLSNYYEQEQALNLLFRKLPQNKKLSQILLKTAALNDFYSTNIFDIYTVARHIY
ncbi:MAG: hypothetical protein LUC91_03690, partial [Prevotella sp.]|nr:hypothetical protein [Prevotella sp.]